MEASVIALFDAVISRVERVEENKGLNGKDGKDGAQGPKGDPGKDGKDGRDGKDGVDGKAGPSGKDGKDGADGVSITNVEVDFDNRVRVFLSNGEEIDAGEIQISSKDGDIVNVGMRGSSENSKAVYEASADYQVAGNVGEEIIICTNTSPITVTLPTIPKNGQIVVVKRQGAGGVTVSGTIDGAQDLIIRNRYEAPQLVYSNAASEWSKI